MNRAYSFAAAGHGWIFRITRNIKKGYGIRVTKGQPSNQALSEKRAQAVVEEIVKEGVDGKRLSAAGFGQTRPIADNKTAEGKAKNRRVELVKK